MKIKEIREMSSDELGKRIKEEELSIVDLRFSHELKQLTNTAKLKIAKRDIARMKTILHERDSEAKKASNNKIEKEL
jgi:large subunit ribosomal protein L29